MTAKQTPLAPRGWKPLAWNGLCVAIPPAWEPGRIGERHLLIEADAGPAMEIKWGPVRGQFSHRRHFQRLRKVTAARAVQTLECPLPAEWEPPLRPFETAGFCWTDGSRAASGVILNCPRSRTGALVQFFHRPEDSGFIRPAGAVLGSLRFHDGGGPVRWAVFDVRAELPQRFSLVRHRFEPGRFTLRFLAGRCRIDLYRWAPAAVLLKGRDLTRFAQTVSGLEALQFQATAGDEPAAVEGRRPAATGLMERLTARSGLRTVCRARLWHVPEKNRILGVRMEDRGVIDSDVWTMMSQTYGVVDLPAGAGPHEPR